MPSKKSVTDHVDATAHLALVHPVIAALEAAMIDQENRLRVAGRAMNLVQPAFRKIDSTQWSSSIESAYDKPEELASIRSQFGEEALAFSGAWLNYSAAIQSMDAGRTALDNAIADGFIELETLNHRNNSKLVQIFRTRLVVASELQKRKVTESFPPPGLTNRDGMPADWICPSAATFALIDKIQRDAFAAMTSGLAANFKYDLYPISAAVPNKSRRSHRFPDGEECRKLRPVAFVDCRAQKHEKSIKLAELLLSVDAALEECSSSGKQFRPQKGEVNERQHCDRLLQFLHADPAAPKTREKAESLKEQVHGQGKRRHEFESNRQRHALDVHYLRILLDNIVQALKEAVSETESFMAEVAGQTQSYSEEQILRTMLHNCLCTDASMRSWVRELLEREETIKDDITNGAAERSTNASFAALIESYAFHVKNRKSLLAPMPEAKVTVAMTDNPGEE